jgi:hypothetical protein
MPRRPSPPASSDQARQDMSAATARPHLLDTEFDRPRRIDQYIDYFGSGGTDRPFLESPDATGGMD